MSKFPHAHPLGYVIVPAAAIGSLSILLAVGLSMLGILDRINLLVSRWLSAGGTATFPKSVPDGWLWLASVAFAMGLAFVMLNVAGTWRRLVVWITALFLIAGWAPVLSLAARSPEVGAPFIAALWSGICALIYTGNHRIPHDKALGASEKSPTLPPDETR